MHAERVADDALSGRPDQLVAARWLGRVGYEEVWALQRRLQADVVAGAAERLLLVEHPPVITLGRSADERHVLRADVPVVRVNRGGDVTYHGPGQLVGYPILDLRHRGGDVHRYLRNLEGMLTAHMVTVHTAVMEFFRRAMHEEQTLVGQTQNLNHAMKLMSMYMRQLEVLDKHRGKGQQKVTVEYVNVESGGQAIVGQVEAGRGPKRRKGPATSAMSPAIDDAPEVPLEIPDPVVRQRTPQKVPQKVRRGR